MTDTHDTRQTTVTAAKVRGALRAAGVKAPSKHLPGVTVQDFGSDGIFVSWDTRTSILNGTSRDRAIDRAAAALAAKNIPFDRVDCGEDRGGRRFDLVIGVGR